MIEADHMEMCKFNDPADIGYQRINDFITEFIGHTAEERVDGEP